MESGYDDDEGGKRKEKKIRMMSSNRLLQPVAHKCPELFAVGGSHILNCGEGKFAVPLKCLPR